MTSITTRAGKGTPLTHTEVDDNFTNLNADKLEASNNLSDVSSASAARTNLGLATVASTGGYSDLTGLPTLGTAAATASTDYATAAQGTLAGSAVQPNDSPTFAGLTTTANVSFGDNDRIVMGAGGDLQIFHNGSQSYIQDNGTGILILQGSTGVHIQGRNGTDMIRAQEGSAVQLYHNDIAKFATSSTGVSVTGAVVSQDEVRAEVVAYGSNQNAPYMVAASTSYTGAATNWGTYGFQHRLKSDGSGTPRITVDDNAAELYSLDGDGDAVFAGAVTATSFAGDGSALTGLSAPIKAWVRFNGTGTVAINESFNVSSITDNGTGEYTVNFTTNMSSTTYGVIAASSANTSDDGTQNRRGVLNKYSNFAVGSVKVRCSSTTDGAVFDAAYVTVSVYN